MSLTLFSKKIACVSVYCFGLVLYACGGSSSNNSPSSESSSPQTENSVQWEMGVYTAQSNHSAKCENPRSGIDPFSGEPYPDVTGTTLDEKLWLRTFTYETYLWFDEVPDNDPELFSVPAYFDQLKTTELTQSGNVKDNFHFSIPTEQNNQRSQGGVTSGYGFNWAFGRSFPPRSFVVRYVETGSPADVAGIKRGARLSKINDIDFINTTSRADIDVINSALFPETVGEPYSFTFTGVNNQEETVVIASDDNIQISAVQNVNVVDTDLGRIGYMQYNTFNRNSQNDLIAAFSTFNEQSIDELVIDLRYNGGGLLVLSSQIAYMIAGADNTAGKTYYQSRQNSKIPSSRPLDFVNREIDYEQGRFTSTILPSVSLNRVYILSTDNTCSASEAVINGLKGVDVEVVLMGSKTCGKPYGFVPQDNCGTTYFTIQSQGVNAKGFGDYVNGFVPTQNPTFEDDVLGCQVDDDLDNLLGSTEESVFAAAIQHMETGTCPTQFAALRKFEAVEDKSEAVIAIPQPVNTILVDDRDNYIW